MAEKKVESPAVKASRIAFFRKTFMGIIFVICVLGGLAVGIFINRHFLEGQFVSEGIGNTLSAQSIFYPNRISLEAVINVIKGSQSSISFLGDTIKSRMVLDAISEKAENGVALKLIFGQGAPLSEGSPIFYLYNKGLRQIYVDTIPASQPLMVIDSRYLLLGTSGYSTEMSEKTTGIFLLLDSPKLAKEAEKFIEGRAELAKRVRD
jgi:hypothetical protein